MLSSSTAREMSASWKTIANYTCIMFVWNTSYTVTIIVRAFIMLPAVAFYDFEDVTVL